MSDTAPSPGLRSAAFLLAEAAFLAAAHVYGGPTWTILGGLAFFGRIVSGSRLPPLAVLLAAVAWLAASRVTGSREYFFPYSMHLAACVAVAFGQRSAWLGGLGGLVVAAAFMLVRVLEQATPRVLLVEGMVAALILGAVVTAAVKLRGRSGATVAIVAGAAAVACAGLAL
jgi:hypothetical protein